MKLALTQEEIKDVIISIFANGGLSYFEFELSYDDKLYQKYKVGNCFEDNLYSILENDGKITFIDNEDGDSEYTTDLTMDLIKERFNTVTDEVFIQDIMTTVSGEDDAETGYNLIQWLLFNEIIFG